MRAHLVSDLHVDIEGNGLAAMPATDADVTIVAGDAAAPGGEALKRVRELFTDSSRPLIYTPGNQDYYSFHDKYRPHLKTTFERERMRETAAALGIILLDDSVAVIGGVRSWGAPAGPTSRHGRPMCRSTPPCARRRAT